MTSVPIERVIEEVRRTLKRGDLVRAVGMVRELARQAGQDPRSRSLQALMAIEFGQAKEAVGLLETLIFELTGDELRQATVALTRARQLLGDLDAALTTIRPELESEQPPAAAIGIAAELNFQLGNDAKAISLLDDAIVTDKDAHEIAAARAFIALRTPADHSDRDARELVAIEALTAESERVGVPASSLMVLLLELGELLARRGNDEGAARAWKRSASLSPYRMDPRTYGKAVASLLQSWNEKSTARARVVGSGPGAVTERPVFVVGLPGGGAHLVADLLAACPGAVRTKDAEALSAAVGRHLAPANAAGQPVVPDPSKLTGKQLESAAAMYLSRTDPGDEAVERVIDAFELNLHTLGVVAQLFPKARVVFVKRETFDASLACMLAHRDPRLLYANDPNGLAVFAGGIARLTNLWSGLFAGEHLPLEHAVIDYDELITDPSVRERLFATAGVEAPADSVIQSVLDEHARATATQPGLAARFATQLPQLTSAVEQIALDRV